MKKILSLLVASCMVLQTSMFAFAEETNTAPEQPETTETEVLEEEQTSVEDESGEESETRATDVVENTETDPEDTTNDIEEPETSETEVEPGEVVDETKTDKALGEDENMDETETTEPEDNTNNAEEEESQEEVFDEEEEEFELFNTDSVFSPIDETLWFDSERECPFDTGYELYEETEFIRNNPMNGQVFLSEDAYEGRFSIGVKAIADETSMLPIKMTDVVSLQNSRTSRYPRVNKLVLYIKPMSGADTISFYIESYSYPGTYIKIVNDYNKDGAFVVGEDLSQGIWNKVTLDLAALEQICENGLANNLYVSVNESSTWHMDYIKGDYLSYETTNGDLSKFVKKGLIFQNGKLSLDSSATSGGTSIISRAKFDINQKLSSIEVEDEYSPYSQEKKLETNENYLPDDILSNINYWDIEGTATFTSENSNPIIYAQTNSVVTLNLASLENYTAISSANCKYKVVAYVESLSTSTNKAFTVGTNEGLLWKHTLPHSEWTITETIIPSTTERVSFSCAYNVNIRSLKLIKLPNTDTSISSTIPSSLLIETDTYSDNTYSSLYGDTIFPGINTNHQGAIAEYSNNLILEYKTSKTDYIVVKVINPNVNTDSSKIYFTASATYPISYGENEYLIAGRELSKIYFYNKLEGSLPIIIAEIKKYSAKTDISRDIQEKTINLPDNSSYLYSRDSNTVYFISSDTQKLCSYDINSGETKELIDGKVVSINAISPESNYVLYRVKENNIYLYYSYNTLTGTQTLLGTHDSAVGINDTGVAIFIDSSKFVCSDLTESFSVPDIYYVNDNLDMIVKQNNHSKTVDGLTVKYSNLYVYKKENIGWLLESSVSMESGAVTNVLFSNDDKLFISNDKIWEYNLSTENLRELDITGTLLSITDSNYLVIDNEDYLTLYNTSTRSKDYIKVTPDTDFGVYYDEFRSRLIYTSTDGELCLYSLVPADRIIKAFVSLDNYKWYTFKDGGWTYVGNTTMLDDNLFTSHGMDMNTVSSIKESDYSTLYSMYGVSTNLLSVSLALRFSSTSSTYYPSINSITLRTVVEDDSKSLYAIRGEYHDKSSYSKINTIYPIETKPSYAENYYFLALGDDAVFTYKNGSFVVVESTVENMVYEIEDSWIDIKQQGMTAAELSSIPSDALTALLVSDYDNEGFTIVNCIKTLGDTTKEITVEYRLSADNRYSFGTSASLEITMSDGTSKSLNNLSEDEIQKFFTWLEKRQAGIGSIYYSLDVSGGKIFINYYNILSVEVSA